MKIVREKPGIISKDPCWVAVDGPYLYISDTFLGLVWEIVSGWRKDRNLVG